MRDALGRPQTVLVLGGRSDLAAALVRELAPQRAILGVRDPQGPDELRFDALDRASHAAFVEEAFAGGDVDVVVLAFGVLEGDPVEVVETNLLGAVSVLPAVAERLRAQGHGAIVVFSSIAAERPRRANYVYGASKAGLDAFAQGLGDELHGSGVQVLVVRPGFVHTKMTAGRPAAPLATTPDAVAEVVVEALRRGAHTVWAPKPARVLALVLRLLPRPLLRQLKR